jgi:hypothetical protein
MSRISKIAVELNISSVKLIDVLIKKFSDQKFTINQKLTDEEIDFLKNEFDENAASKIRRFRERNTYLYDVYGAFDFNEKEILQFKNLYKRYSNLIFDIENLKLKNNKYWGLDEDEISAISRIKFGGIEEIQNEIIGFREDEEDRIQKVIEHNERLQDLYIHKEASSIAQWDID